MGQCCAVRLRTSQGPGGKAFTSEDAPPSFKPHLPTPESQGRKSVKKRLETGSWLQGKLLYCFLLRKLQRLSDLRASQAP